MNKFNLAQNNVICKRNKREYFPIGIPPSIHIFCMLLTAIISYFDCQLLMNKLSFTPCSIYILLIFNKFYKFWMSCACTRLCTKNKPKRAHSGPQTELISHGGQGFIIRPVSGNRRPLVPVYRTGLTGYR